LNFCNRLTHDHDDESMPMREMKETTTYVLETTQRWLSPLISLIF
jgi:hypothetical protein